MPPRQPDSVFAASLAMQTPAKLMKWLVFVPALFWLKSNLTEYHTGVKISMGVSTREEYADKIAYTETLREKIRDLESKLE